MISDRVDRAALLAGAVFVLLFGGGSALTLIDSPSLGGPSVAAQTYFIDQVDYVYWGGVVSMLAIPFLILFAARVQQTMVGRWAAPSLVGSVAFGSGVAAAGVVAVEVMSLTVGALRVRESGDISPDTAAVLFDLSTGIGGIGIPVTLAAMQFAVGTALWALPVRHARSLGFATILIAVLSVVLPLSLALFVITLLWVLAFSISLFAVATVQTRSPHGNEAGAR